MFKELYIALRYIRTKRRQTILSSGAVAIAVAIMVVTLGLVAGFSAEILDTTLGNIEHVKISPDENEDYIYLYNHLVTEVENVDHVVAVSPLMRGSVTLSHNDNRRNLILSGVIVDREDAVYSIRDDLVEGSFDEVMYRPNSIVISTSVADDLEVMVGDSVTGFFPGARQTSFRVVGIYDPSGFGTSVAYTSIETAQKFYQESNVVTSVSVKIDDVYNDKIVAEDIRRMGYNAEGWTERHPEILQTLMISTLINALETGLVAIIASFGVVSALNMMVMSKVKEIGILMAMGMKKKNIRRIFLIQSTLLGFIGAIVGTIIGYTAAYLLDAFGLTYSFGDLGEIPIIIRTFDVIVIIVAITFLNLLAGIYPAHKASNLDPVKAIFGK
ncbi:ABC transporter permease [Methanosalsum natronophilum]|nr:ABC transporter permease [Methanosalsum natronophilum]MCS3924771.1 lipoprotein-releasing system permease protein [Methanosalsum natronophilum]